LRENRNEGKQSVKQLRYSPDECKSFEKMIYATFSNFLNLYHQKSFKKRAILTNIWQK